MIDKKLIGYFLVVAFSLGLIMTIFALKKNELNSTISELIKQNKGLYEEVTTVRNKSVDLAQALELLDDENTRLTGLLSEMKTPVAEIKYIVQTKTILKASEPIVIYAELPPEHNHMLNTDIPVAKFVNDENAYSFHTYDLSFKNTLIVGKKDSAVLLQIHSSAEEENVWHEVPAELTVLNLEQKFPSIFPQIAIGAGVTSTTLVPQPKVDFPLFHITEGLDILTPGLLLGQDPSLSVSGLNYNIANHLPLVSDLWLSIGASLNTQLKPGLTIGVTTKL